MARHVTVPKTLFFGLHFKICNHIHSHFVFIIKWGPTCASLRLDGSEGNSSPLL